MPAIWTFGPDNVTGIDLSANAFWRVTLSAVTIMQQPWLSLSLIYPPAAGQSILQTQIVLTKTGVPCTDKIEDVLRVAQVSISSGSQEKDRERMTEAFNLFKNGKVKQEVLEVSLRDALEILDAYWQVRGWLQDGAREEKDIAVAGYVLKLKP
jgi:hypothetical protein